MWAYIGFTEIEITKAQAASIDFPGRDCEPEVKELLQVPKIRRQFAKFDPKKLRDNLAEYGAWTDEELQDHEQNKIRTLWLACSNINDGED